MKMLRSPICSVVGHVDHGKSTILDYIRNTKVTSREVGGITQAIGASFVPLNVIEQKLKGLTKSLNLKLDIPGVLFIDTPGHAAFTSLRKIGGDLADLSILVVDINEGFKPQTLESIQILKEHKTPFIVIANKIDSIPGFKHVQNLNLLKSLSSQSQEFQIKLEEQTYKIVGELYSLGFNSERFDRVQDYTKQIAIIPTSGKTGDGIPEMLMVLLGLIQKYLKNNLELQLKNESRGTIIEVKNLPHFGTILDVILYDGILRTGDFVAIGTLSEPIITKIKGLFVPESLSEIRETKSKFKSTKEVLASAIVRIYAQNTENAISGMPILSSDNEYKIKEYKKELKQEIQNLVFEKSTKGLFVKADSLGSLDALLKLLNENNINVKKASIGNITKKDIQEAKLLKEEDELQGVILGFNVSCEESQSEIDIITDNVIYRIIDKYKEWFESKKKKKQLEELSKLNPACKLRILPNYIFRQSNPAIVGVEILLGKLKSQVNMMNLEGKIITKVKEIQLNGKNVSEVKKDAQVAVSFLNVTVGKQIKPNDILYTSLTSEEFKNYKEFKDLLTDDEKECLNEIAMILRKKNPSFGL